MRIYRVETQDGEGPYRSEISAGLDCWDQIPCADDIHPTLLSELDYLPPYREVIRRWGYSNVRYAFAFNDQLNRWFDGYLEKLAPYGFGVSEYEISPRSVYVTPTQAIYNAGAKSLKRISWTPLLDLLREKGSETVDTKSPDAATVQTPGA